MNYKGYSGQIFYDSEERLFHGRVIGLKDVITFQGKNVDEIEQAFKDSIEDYLEWCKELGESPEKSFSGKLHLRISPHLHAQLAKEAQLQDVSLNTLITEKLKRQ